jgi:ubiquinone/menaquinone biosynthesis C-methylase UbiE
MVSRLTSVDLNGPGVDALSSVENLCFSSESFDIVLSLDMLEHVVHDVAAISEMSRVLRSGGMMLVTASCWGEKGPTKTPEEAGCAPFHIGMSGKWDCRCYRYYTEDSLCDMLHSAGLRCRVAKVSDGLLGILEINVIVCTK